MTGVSLRQWRDSDLEPFAAMNRDLEVMRFFPALLKREESEAWLHRQRDLIDERGWGLWAVEVDGEFAGFTGLAVPRFKAAFTPCVEIGWRLRREFWGRSIAYRAAIQALDYGFDILQLPEIVSFTAAVNARSRRLMERLGFAYYSADDFNHPATAAGHELRPHVLYRKLTKNHQSGDALTPNMGNASQTDRQ
jgi:RimJ/RimL family protein N-acetyltransferase